MVRFSRLSKKARNRRSAGAWAAANIGSGDFTNIATNNAADGVYTLNGETVAIGDIIDLAHPSTVFDPVADIDAGGIHRHEDGGNFFATVLHLKDPLKTQLKSGFTVVIEFLFPSSPGTIGIEMGAKDDDDSPAPYSVANTDYIECWSYDDSSDLYVDTISPEQGQTNKFAVTWTDAKQSMCLNGGAVQSHAAPGVGPDLDQFWFSLPGTNADLRIASFAFYEPVDDADLPTLSAL